MIRSISEGLGALWTDGVETHCAVLFSGRRGMVRPRWT